MRTPGYYWVKYRNSWMPAKYASDYNYWLLIGYEGSVEEEELAEIGDWLEHYTNE